MLRAALILGCAVASAVNVGDKIPAGISLDYGNAPALASPTAHRAHRPPAHSPPRSWPHTPAHVAGFPPAKIDLAKRVAGKKVVVVGLPGAFTPT